MPNASLGVAYYKGDLDPLGLGPSLDHNISLPWSNDSMPGEENTDFGGEVQFRKSVPLLKQSMPVVIALSVAYSLVFLLAVVNNSLVVSVIYRNPQMRNVTNYLLANLAVADITVSFIVLPITLLSNIFTGKTLASHHQTPLLLFLL